MGAVEAVAYSPVQGQDIGVEQVEPVIARLRRLVSPGRRALAAIFPISLVKGLFLRRPGKEAPRG
jgi:hypothetical protein